MHFLSCSKRCSIIDFVCMYYYNHVSMRGAGNMCQSSWKYHNCPHNSICSTRLSVGDGLQSLVAFEREDVSLRKPGFISVAAQEAIGN